MQASDGLEGVVRIGCGRHDRRADPDAMAAPAIAAPRCSIAWLNERQEG